MRNKHIKRLVLFGMCALMSFPAEFEVFADKEVQSEVQNEVQTEVQAEEEQEVWTKARSEEVDNNDINIAELQDTDFASKRLIVLTEDESIIDGTENVIAQYGDIYIIQYETVIQCKNAFAYYVDKADAAEPDMTVTAADETATDAKTDITVTKEENPLDTLSGIAQNAEVVSEGKEPLIALLDTGAALSDNVIGQVSMIGDEMVSGVSKHGEDMAGYIVSQNEDAQILSVRVLDDNGKGTVSSIVAGIEYAISQSVDYINLSLYAKNNLSGSVIVSEIKKAVSEGITVIGAAGNSSTYADNFVPGAVEEAYIIGAVNEDGTLNDTSNYGDTVDYYVVSDSTSEAAALFTGYVTKHGFDKVPADGFIFDSYVEDESVLEPTHGAATDYILENLDQKYIEYDEDTKGYGEISSLLLKRTYVEEGYVEDSIAGYFDGIRGETEDTGFLTTTKAEIPLYDVNAYSYYIVGRLNIDDEDFIDVDFARRGVEGEAFKNAYYDSESGLVYVKKADLLTTHEFEDDTDKAVIIYNDIQAQALIESDGSIIEDMLEEDAIYDKIFTDDDLEVTAAQLIGNEAPVPTSSIPEIVGSLKQGDQVSFTVDPHNGVDDSTYAYLYSLNNSSGNKESFYEALETGDIPEAYRLWNIVSPADEARYNGITWGKYPAYADFHFRTSEIGNITMIDNCSAMYDWAVRLSQVRAADGGDLRIAMDCTHILEAYAGADINTITATVIETGSNYAVIGLLSNGRINATGTQAMAGIYVVAYRPIEQQPLKITVNKQDDDGDPVYGAEFTVYGYSSTTGGYTVEVASDVTDEENKGQIVFDGLEDSSGLPRTANGLFLVKETETPDGYSKSEDTGDYLNADDKNDFDTLGGRLYFVPAMGGDCPAYRDTDALTVMFEGDNNGNKIRLVYDHTGYFISDKWDITWASSVKTCWWTRDSQGKDIVGQTWYEDKQMSGGGKVWYRSYVDGDNYMVYSGDNYATNGNIFAHTYKEPRRAEDFIAGIYGESTSGNYYGGNGVEDWKETTKDNRVNAYIYNYRRSGQTYKFRLQNNTSSKMYIYAGIWTYDSQDAADSSFQSDVVYLEGEVSPGQYIDYDARIGNFENLSNIIVDIWTGASKNNMQYTGSVFPETCEYNASVFVNIPPQDGYVYIQKISATPEITDNNECYSLKGAVYGVYTDKACKDLVTELTTEEDGSTPVEQIGHGTYYVREITASKGYQLDRTVHEITVTSANTEDNPAVIESKEVPGNDPADIQINKIGAGQKMDTAPSLAGTQFTFTFYGGQYDSVAEAENAVKNEGITKRTWVLEAKYDSLDNSYKLFLNEIKNTPVFVMPQSGSAGTWLLGYIGIGLVGAAAVIAYISLKKMM
jgi:hypothetical protein